MHRFYTLAALRGDGLRPELQALLDRVADDPRTELSRRHDGLLQAGPDPSAETRPANIVPLTRRRP